MNKLYSFVILLLIQFCAFDFQVSKKDLLIRDFKTILAIDDHDVNLDAYHSKENKEILKKKNPQEYRHLNWFSIGYPIIVESESKLTKHKSLFHFTSKGFYASIQMLTNGQKRMIMNEIKKIHNISVEMNQIVELKPDKLKCELELIGDSEEESSLIKGKVKSFKSTQLIIEFTASADEIKWMKKYLAERKEDIEIYCDIGSAENGFISNNFKLGLQLNKPVNNVI